VEINTKRKKMQSFKKEFLNSRLILASQMSNRYTYRKFIEKWTEEKEEPPPVSVNIPKSRLLLGFSSLNYSTSNIVAPKLNIAVEEGGKLVPKSRVFIIIGRKGSGKSILGSSIILDGIVGRFGVPCLAIDPSPTPEFYRHKYSLRDNFRNEEMQEKFDEYERMFNVEFRGYKISVIKPAFDNSMFKEEGTDKEITLSLADFKESFNFSKLDAIQSLLSVLELEDNRTAEAMIAQILTNEDIKTFGDVVDAMEGKIKFENSDFKNIGRAFETYLNTALMIGVFSKDNGFSNSIINDMIENEAVVIRSKSKTGEDSKVLAKYLVYIKILITKVIWDRIRYVSGTPAEKAKAKMVHPFGIILSIDEADLVVPENSTSYLKDLIEQVATKMRKLGISLVLQVQDSSLLSQTLIAQADGIFCSRIDSEGNIKTLRTRGISEENIKVLRHLDVEKVNSLGLRVSEWAYIGTDNSIISFYPAPPLSAFLMQ
jgi:hypothetical protein